MRHTQWRSLVGLAVVMALIGACSGESGSESTVATTLSTTTTSSTSSTTTSSTSTSTSTSTTTSTTTTSTTTTTTLPPGLEPQELSFGFEPNLLAKYDTVGVVVREGRLSQEDVLGSYELEVGDCVVGGTYGFVPVPCSVAHPGEVVGVVTHETDGDDPPDASALEIQILRRCEREMWDRGQPDYRAAVEPVTDMFAGWDHGVRHYYCIASIRDEYDWPANIIGEFYGDWEFAEEQVGT